MNPSSPRSPGALSLRQYATAAPIAAGANEIFRNTEGNFLYVAEASHAEFYLLLNDKVRLKGRLARGWRFPDGESIVKVQVFNTSDSSALSLLFEVGRGAVIDNGLNVYREEIASAVRSELPSSFTVVSVACTGVENAHQLLPIDGERHHALLFTSSGGEAYYGPTAAAGDWPAVDGNRVGLTLDGSATRYDCTAALYVKGAVGTTVYAFVSSF